MCGNLEGQWVFEIVFGGKLFFTLVWEQGQFSGVVHVLYIYLLTYLSVLNKKNVESWWVSYHASLSHPSPCPFITATCPCNLPVKTNKIQKKNKQTKKNKNSQNSWSTHREKEEMKAGREGEKERGKEERMKSLCLGAVLWQWVTLYTFQSIFLCLRLLQWDWSGSRSLASATPLILRFLLDMMLLFLSWGSCSLGSECLALPHALGVGVDQLSTGSGPGGLLSWQTCQLSLIDTHRTSSPTLRGIADHCSRHWEARAVLLLSLGPSHPHPLHQGLFYSFDQAR